MCKMKKEEATWQKSQNPREAGELNADRLNVQTKFNSDVIMPYRLAQI